MSPTRTPTPERILDAAETLFAERGYDGVSTRAITDQAGVRLNLLSYHFGTKERLFRAVIDRRLDVLMGESEQALARLRESDDPMTVGGVLRAVIHPFYDLASQGDPGWLNYARMVALTSQSEHDYPVIEQYMQRAVDLFIRSLQDVLPGVSESAIKSGFHYALALMLGSFTGMNRVSELVEGTASDEALKRAYRPLIIYAEAGILALAEADRAAQ